MDPSWVKLFAGQGGFVGVVAVMLFIFYKVIWPTIDARLKACDTERVAFSEERKEARKEFTEALKMHNDSLRARDVMVAEIHERTTDSLDKTAEALNRLSGQFQALREDVVKKGK